MKYLPLVHAHLHTSGSLLDGVGNIKNYIAKAKEYNHPAICCTDHGNTISLYQFYNECKKEDIKPILGCEFYITTDLSIKIPNKKREILDKDKHLIVLVKNEQGYKNFCKLSYLSFVEGFYYKPRITFDQLWENKEGLIVTSACAAGMMSQLISNGMFDEADEWFKKFVNEFGDDFYAEIQLNELYDKKEEQGIDQKEINKHIIKLAKKYKAKTILTGDVHYADKEDHKLQDIVINCMQRKDGPATEMGQSFIHARRLYYQSSQDFLNFNKEFEYYYDEEFIKECFENSLTIADKCNFEFNVGANNYPEFNIGDKDHKKYITKLAFKGLENKLAIRTENGEEFSDEQLEEYEKRLEYEIKVIADKGYLDYFLVYQDMISWAKKEGIQVAVGRGSAGGSLLSYSLDIVGLDPIKYGLYFERFLNPDRMASPDIDLDILSGGREKIRGYLEEKYGKESVFGVMTQGLYQAKSALQDASRGLGKDTTFQSTLMREVTKLPEIEDTKELGLYFDNLLKNNALTDSVIEWYEDNQDTIYWADKLIGLTKSVGTHAGGIVIAPGPIYDYIPVTKAGKEIVTAFRESDGSGHDLSDLGILKCDILGIKTLNVIRGCIDDIKADKGIDITNTLENLDLNDPKLYKKFNKGNNVGVFQMEGPAQDFLAKSIVPDCFDDIVAINAINRPGPLEAFGKVYGQWKRWEKEGNTKELEKIEKDRYPFEFMKKTLGKTYGALLYQEQFMLMVCEAGGLNMGEADNLRRAVGWPKTHPKYHTVEKLFKKLEKGMKDNGYSIADTELFLEYCRRFMGYSFNKSHAVSYSYTGMQTLWLKVYYPEYFYANLLSVETYENYQTIIADAVANGIKILFPTINKAKHNFKAENKAIRIGFKALKGFGDVAQQELEDLNLASYENLYDILALPFKKINKTAFQCLIDVGAFDEFGIEREKVEVVRNLYKDPQIEKWFTRDRDFLSIETIPESLLQIKEDILIEALEELKPKELKRRKLIKKIQTNFIIDSLYNKYSKNITREEISQIMTIVDDEKLLTKKAFKLIGIEFERVNIGKDEIIDYLTSIKELIEDSIEDYELPKPWIDLVTKITPSVSFKPLTDKQKDERVENVLGFSLTLVNNLSKLTTLSEDYPDINLKSLSAHEDDDDICYWYLVSKTVAQTKKGKDYWVLKITDGALTVNAKCWEKLDFQKDAAYISHIKKDQWGYMIKVDEVLTQVEI